MMRVFTGVLIILTVLLQYRLWVSDSGISEVLRLQQSVAQQDLSNADMSRRNKQLSAEVTDLKTGTTAIEERARSELGMLAPDEWFYQVVPHGAIIPKAPASVTHTAQR